MRDLRCQGARVPIKGGTPVAIPGVLKQIAARGLSLAPQCRFDRCLFLIGHMRCGSTALANILCSRAEISGYGESHVIYDVNAAPGSLALNQIGKRRWKARARYLFDKILHNNLDDAPPEAFFGARAIFISRDPDAAVPSLVNLFRSIGSSEYATPAEAATYYSERLRRMGALWAAFPPARRISIAHDDLVSAPDAELGRLGAFLHLSPGLSNSYSHPRRAFGPGAGDPIRAPKLTRIVAAGNRSGPDEPQFSAAEMSRARDAFAEFRAITLPAIAE